MNNSFNRLRALVVGSGSIGTRHALNLQSFGLEVVVFTKRLLSDELLHHSLKYVNNDTLISQQRFDICVIASATSRHLSDIEWAIGFCDHFYIEKPLSKDLEGVHRIVQQLKERHSIVDTGFMLRSHPNLLAIQDFLAEGTLGVLHYAHLNVGQWLGDWRPETDYRKSYSASSTLGGGVVLDLIHEIDLAHCLFGHTRKVVSDIGHSDCLEIETEALAHIGLTHENSFKSFLRMDYLRPIYERKMEIVGSLGILLWDYETGVVSVRFRDGRAKIIHRTPENYTRNDMFLSHVKRFLLACTAGDQVRSNLSDAVYALEIACTAKNNSHREG